MQSIVLTVGASSIRIDQSGVTISAPQITLDAQGSASLKSPATVVEGQGVLVLKGGGVMIN